MECYRESEGGNQNNCHRIQNDKSEDNVVTNKLPQPSETANGSFEVSTRPDLPSLFRNPAVRRNFYSRGFPMFSLVSEEMGQKPKEVLSLRKYARYFALGERSLEGSKLSIKALKASLSRRVLNAAKKHKKLQPFPLAFRPIDQESEVEEVKKVRSLADLKNIFVFQHHKGKTLKETLFQFPEEDTILYFLQPGRGARHINNTDDLNYAIKDFLTSKNQLVGKEVHQHIAEAVAGMFSNDDRKILTGVHDIWEVASFSEGYKLIKKPALIQMAVLLEHPHLAVQNACLAAFWSLSYYHRLDLGFLQEHVIPHLTSKKIRSRYTTYNSTNEELLTFHVRSFGLLSCVVCEGGGKRGNILTNEGIDLLVDFIQYPSSPEAHRLGFMALLDAVIGHREPAMHILENQESIEILTHSLKSVDSIDNMIEDMEILCALARSEASEESFLHSADALEYVGDILKRFHDNGINAMKNLTQDQWETIILYTIATLWGIVSGEHAPIPSKEILSFVIDVARTVSLTHGAHETEMLVCCFGFMAIGIQKHGADTNSQICKSSLFFLIEVTLHHHDARVKTTAASALKSLVGADPVTANKQKEILKNVETFSPGNDIVVQGHTNDYIYVILEGTVQVYVDGKNVATMGMGREFGEISVREKTTCKATVRAKGKVQCLKLDIDAYKKSHEAQRKSKTSMIEAKNCWDYILASLENNIDNPSVAIPLLDSLTYLSSTMAIRSTQTLRRLAFLLPGHKINEIERHLGLLWKLACVPENREVMAHDNTTFETLLRVAKRYSSNTRDHLHILYSALCTFWALIGDNHEHNEPSIDFGWVEFLSLYLRESMENCLATPRECLKRLCAELPKEESEDPKSLGMTHSGHVKQSPRIKIHSTDVLPPKFKAPSFKKVAGKTDSRCDAWTVAICCLWTLIDHKEGLEVMVRQDVHTVLLGLSTESGSRIHSLLRVRAAGFFLQMLTNKAHSRNAILAWGCLPTMADQLCVSLLYFDDVDTQCYGAMSITRRASAQNRISLLKLGATERLLQILGSAPQQSALAEYCTQALLNLSTHPTVQRYIPRVFRGKGFETILKLALVKRKIKSFPSQIFAAGILTNLMQHPANRTPLYKMELKERTGALYGELQQDPEQFLQETLDSTVQEKGKLRNLNSSDPRAQFLRWVSKELDGQTSEAESTNCDFSSPKKSPTRPFSPRKEYDNTTGGFKKSLSQVPKTLSSNMCKPLNRLWEDTMPCGVKDFAATIYHSDTPPILSQPSGGISCTLTSLKIPSLSPWEPQVSSIDWSTCEISDKKLHKNIQTNAHVSQSGEVLSQFEVILEPPESPRSHFKFTPSSVSMPGSKPRLSCWPHVKGAKSGKHIFPSYTMADGQVMYFYEDSKIQEAHIIPEAPPRVPKEPTQFGTPVFSPIDPPESYSIKHPPKLHSLPPPDPPPPPHTKLDEVLESTAHDMICFAYGQAKHVQLFHNKRKNSVDPNAWTLEKSVFAARSFDNDSGNFWEDAVTDHLAFDLDWQRCVDKASFRSIFSQKNTVIHPFEEGDAVELLTEEVTQKIDKGKVRSVHHSGHVSVNLDNGLLIRDFPIAKVRFSGGDWCGIGGKNPRIHSHGKETEVEHKVQAGLILELKGTDNAVQHIIEHFSLCSIIYPNDDVVENSSPYDVLTVVVRGNSAFIEKGSIALEEAICVAKAKQEFLLHMDSAYSAFNYFKGVGSGSCAVIQETQFFDFIRLCHITDDTSESCRVRDIGDILRRVVASEMRHAYSEKKDRRVLDELEKPNPHRVIRRFEFIQLLVTIATQKYQAETHGDIPKCIQLMFERNIEKHLLGTTPRVGNVFRDNKMYNESICKVLKHNLYNCIKLFAQYGSPDQHTADREFYMSPDEYVSVMTQMRLLDHRFTRRVCRNCASWSLNMVIDDVKNQYRAGAMTFTDFLECLCRTADTFAIPTDLEMQSAGCTNVSEYILKQRKKNKAKQSKQDNKSFEKQVSRLERVQSMLVRDDALNDLAHASDYHEVDQEPLPKRLKKFFEFLFFSAREHLSRFRAADGGDKKWKMRKIQLQYNSNHFERRNDRRFLRLRKKKKKREVTFHSGRAQYPECIMFTTAAAPQNHTIRESSNHQSITTT